MADDNKISSLLGFARKAGKLAVGRSAVVTAHKQKKLTLAILANDATPKAERIVANLRGVATIHYGTKDDLGALLGRDQVGIIGVLDHGFAASLKRAITS